MTKLENPVLMATIGAAQGLRGEVRVRTYTADATALADYGNLHSEDGRVFEILEIREAKNIAIVRFRGINDRNAAEALAGLELFIERDNLPDDELEEDEFYYADLEGLEAVDEEGKSYGTVSAVFDFGAGDLLELKGPGRRPALIPFSEAAVLEIDLEGERSSSIRRRRGLPRTRKTTARRRVSPKRQVGAMTFRATILTLYPEMFPGHLGYSLAGKAMERGQWSLDTVQIRDFAEDRHRTVDDTPAGGGAGMVLKPDILAKAIDDVSDGDNRPRLLMSPRGKPLTQERVRELAAGDGVVIICGRFEGVDQRVIDARHLEEVSIGDYVLSGGEPAALTLLDAVVRILPGVMGNALSGTHESFENGLLEHPHYTRPQVFESQEIPAVLTSGNHAAIEKWRLEEARKLTAERRPDLLAGTLRDKAK